VSEEAAWRSSTKRRRTNKQREADKTKKERKKQTNKERKGTAPHKPTGKG
jgi:hypothetical protein